MRPTIKDVAKRAGVSHTTVSMVIHNDKRITEETKQKVLKAIKEINYYPNYSARSLIQGKSNTIAFVTPFFYFSSFFEIYTMHGLEKYNLDNKNKYVIQQFTTGPDNERRNELLRELLYGRRADAIIGLGFVPNEKIIEEYRDKKVPIVLIDARAKFVHTVRADNYYGAYIATEYLIKKGRKKIGLISAPFSASLAPEQRFNGYKDALKNYGIEFREENIIYVEHFLFEEGKEAIKEFVEKKIDIDAIFSAAGDWVAMGVVTQARKLGIKIPEDIAIVGYDDIIVSETVMPPLTTVRQPTLEMGKKAFEIAVDAIDGKFDKEVEKIFKPELIIRESA